MKTPRTLSTAVFILVLFSSICATRAETLSLDGRYEVEGRSVGGQTYRGTVDVQATGATYRVTWKVGQETYVGTGILRGTALAVVYATSGQTAAPPGLVLYDLRPDGSLVGSYTTLGGDSVAPEAWRKGRGT